MRTVAKKRRFGHLKCSNLRLNVRINFDLVEKKVIFSIKLHFMPCEIMEYKAELCVFTLVCVTL